MAQQTINVGSGPNTGGGDPLRDAMIKINENFTELYAEDATMISLATLKAEVAASTDFADFQTRIAAL